MTTTRTVANTAAPLVDPGGGTVRNGTRVQFTLVNAATLEPCSAFDAETGEEISGTKAVTTTSGVFTVGLWPNDRGTPATKYLCTINAPNFTPFAGIVRDEVGTLDFVDFFSDGQVLTPAEISTLLTHIGDLTVHLTAAQNTFLDALNLPTLTAAEVNFLIGVTSAVQTQLNAKQPLDATLTALAAANWDANALPIGSGSDTLSQVSFAANTFPARASSGNLVAKTITDFALGLLDDANAATMRATLGLIIGTDVQAFAATLSLLAALSVGGNANKLVAVNATSNGFELVEAGAVEALNLTFVTNPVIGEYDETPTVVGPSVGTYASLSVYKGEFNRSVRIRTIGTVRNESGGSDTGTFRMAIGATQWDCNFNVPDGQVRALVVAEWILTNIDDADPRAQRVHCRVEVHDDDQGEGKLYGSYSTVAANIDSPLNLSDNQTIDLKFLSSAGSNFEFTPHAADVIRGG